SNLGFMVRNASFRSFADYQNYIVRLQDIPRYMEQETGWLKVGMAEGYTQPKAAMQGFEESIAAFIAQNPHECLFYQPFTGTPPNFVTAEQWRELQQQAAKIIDEAVVPAYQAYFDFMVMEYLPNCRDSVGDRKSTR